MVSEGLKISRLVDFHIDTGASTSIILDKDLRYLKLDVAKLRKDEEALIAFVDCKPGITV